MKLLYVLTFFKETAHSANQPNTLNEIRLPHSTNTNLTRKPYAFTGLTEIWIGYEVLKDTRLASKASLFYHPERNACQANWKSSSGSKLKNPEAYNPHWGLDTISNMSYFVNVFFGLPYAFHDRPPITCKRWRRKARRLQAATWVHSKMTGSERDPSRRIWQSHFSLSAAYFNMGRLWHQ